MGIREYLKQRKSSNPLRYFSHKVLYILLAALLLVFIFLTISMASTGFNNRSTYYFGVRPTLIITGSMEPTIMTNSMVIVEEVSFDEVNLGDIIRYNASSGLSVVHRVIEKGDNYLITKGDNNEYPDNEPVWIPQLNGRVTTIYNGVAPVITSVFGKFNPTDIGSGMISLLLGFVKLAVLLTMFIFLGVFIFEILTINTFWLKKQESMQKSLEWMNLRKSQDTFNADIENYRNALSLLKHHPLKKLVLKIKFRKYYNKVCNEEKEVYATQKYRNTFIKDIEAINKRDN